MTEEVRSEKLGEVADEFDAIHTIQRALRVGSVDRIIPAAELRPYVVDALERGMARTLEPVTLTWPARPRRSGLAGRRSAGRERLPDPGVRRARPRAAARSPEAAPGAGSGRPRRW